MSDKEYREFIEYCRRAEETSRRNYEIALLRGDSEGGGCLPWGPDIECRARV